jgi:hypothetical protein
MTSSPPAAHNSPYTVIIAARKPCGWVRCVDVVAPVIGGLAHAGLKHKLSSVPVTSRTTKLHSAISPSMNDQWSGKTLRRYVFAKLATPTRSSSQSTTSSVALRSSVPVPVPVRSAPVASVRLVSACV